MLEPGEQQETVYKCASELSGVAIAEPREVLKGTMNGWWREDTR
jgi:hypothetical protein